MADNVAITAGSGTNIATDEVTTTGEHVQLFKLAISADGSRTLIPGDASNGLLVDVSRVTGQVQIGDGTNAVSVDNSQSDAEGNGANSLHVSSRNYLYNGTTWDRARGSIANGLLVDVSRIQGSLPAGSNTIGFVGITDGSNSLVVDTAHNDGESTTENHVDTASKLMGYNGTTWDRLRSSIANGLQVDVTRIASALPAGSNLIGTVGISDGTNPVVVDTSASDNESAGTASLVVNSRLKLFNGTGWDRVRGDITNGIDVDVTRVQGTVVIGDGTNPVSIDTSGTDAEGNVNQLHVQGRGYIFNGSTWDRQRGFSTVNKTAQYTAAQTGAALWTPAAGRAVVVTALQIQAGGTTAGAVQVWFGGAADTTYTRGTDAAVFDGEFAPSATNKPGIFVTLPTPVRGTADFVLRVTSSAAINPLTVNAWGYEV